MRIWGLRLPREFFRLALSALHMLATAPSAAVELHFTAGTAFALFQRFPAIKYNDLLYLTTGILHVTTGFARHAIFTELSRACHRAGEAQRRADLTLQNGNLLIDQLDLLHI